MILPKIKRIHLKINRVHLKTCQVLPKIKLVHLKVNQVHHKIYQVYCKIYQTSWLHGHKIYRPQYLINQPRYLPWPQELEKNLAGGPAAVLDTAINK